MDNATRPIEIIGGRVYTHLIECVDEESGDPFEFGVADEFRAQVRVFAQSSIVLAEFEIDDSEKGDGKITIALDEDQTRDIGADGVWDFVWYVDGDDPVSIVEESEASWQLGVTREGE